VVSWQSVALHFADRGGACVLLDRSANVHLYSAALEKLLGWSREQVEGRGWLEAVVPPSQIAVVRGRLERALSGTLRSFECEAAGTEGRRFRLQLEAALVGRGDEQGVLLTVTSAQPILDESGTRLTDDFDYEISASVSEFGRILAMSPSCPATGGSIDLDARCFAVLHGRDAPCADCPALRTSGEPWPRTTARRVRGKKHGYEVVTAEAVEDRVRVRLRRISEDTIGAIYESRVRDLADAAHLSERERSVLTYLLLGRAVADIATILNISPRTVKFHQANVLEKLGADSRADLIRLVT
jgi:PAS domain S-box-containing protein